MDRRQQQKNERISEKIAMNISPGQTVHDWDEPPLYVPVAQMVQVGDPVSLYFPASQLLEEQNDLIVALVQLFYLFVLVSVLRSVKINQKL